MFAYVTYVCAYSMYVTYVCNICNTCVYTRKAFGTIALDVIPFYSLFPTNQNNTGSTISIVQECNWTYILFVYFRILLRYCGIRQMFIVPPRWLNTCKKNALYNSGDETKFPNLSGFSDRFVYRKWLIALINGSLCCSSLVAYAHW